MFQQAAKIALGIFVGGVGVWAAGKSSETPGKNAFTCIFKKKVVPQTGSVMMVSLAATCEHTGIYLGDGKIAEVNSSGKIIEASYEKFTEGLSIGYMIYCAVNKEGKPVCDEKWADRARSKLNSGVKYNPIRPKPEKNEINCHNFVISCIQDNFNDNTACYFRELDGILRSKGFDHWQPVWHKILK